MSQPGDPLVWLQSVDPIFVDFTITEADFGRLKPGLPISATFSAYPDEQFRGEIATTDAKIDESSRMITVRGTLANPDGRLVPGMYANVAVDAGAPETVVTVAQTAVSYSLYGDSVFVLIPPKEKAGEGKDEVFDIERRFVKVGPMRDGRVQHRRWFEEWRPRRRRGAEQDRSGLEGESRQFGRA